LIDKIMGGNPVFRGTRVPVHMLAELVLSRVSARTRYRRGSVSAAGDRRLRCWPGLRHGDGADLRRPDRYRLPPGAGRFGQTDRIQYGIGARLMAYGLWA
jgi:hypothetical protein